MMSILVKRIPCTNTGPTRVKAIAEKHTLTMSIGEFDPNLIPEVGVAIALIKKLDWYREGQVIHKGCLPSGDTVLVFDNPIEVHLYEQSV